MMTYSARCVEINDGISSDYVFVVTGPKLQHHRVGDIIQVSKFGNDYSFRTSIWAKGNVIAKVKIIEIIEEKNHPSLRY